MKKKLNKRKCKQCGVEFQKLRPLQMTCSAKCAIDYANKLKEIKEKKNWKKKQKEWKEKLKTKKDYEKELEVIFNKYIRIRDRNEPCISCGAKATTYKLTAGHYFPAGSYKNIRFDEDNVHGQCWYNCNKNKSGNLIEYRGGLMGKIGKERLEDLEKRAREPRHYTIPELIELKEIYKEKIRKLENEKETK